MELLIRYTVHWQRHRSSQSGYEVENNFDYSPGTYYFKAYVNSIDQFPNNDTMISSLMITPDVRIDSIVDIGCETVGVMVYNGIYKERRKYIGIEYTFASSNRWVI